MFENKTARDRRLLLQNVFVNGGDGWNGEITRDSELRELRALTRKRP